MARGGDERARVGIVRRGVSLFARAKHRGGGRRLGRTVARETRSSRDDDADDADDENKLRASVPRLEHFRSFFQNSQNKQTNTCYRS